MAKPSPSRLDANQVLQGSYDEATGRLRTDSVATVINADIDVQLDAANDNVAIADLEGDFLQINDDGSINVKIDEPLDVVVTAPVQIDGTVPVSISQTVPVSLAQTVDVSVTNPIVGFATESTLLNIEAALTNPLQIIEPLKTSGTIDGTLNGTEYITVNNVRQQILASHDREQTITYADFGTINQRVIRIDYASPTFSGITARKTITYTPVGNSYRRDSINWSII